MRKYLFFFAFFFLSQSLVARDKIYIQKTNTIIAEKESILILPGFGSTLHGTKDLFHFFSQKGYDVFIPNYISRKSIGNCTEKLDKFIVKHKLLSYKKMHVFAFILGSWTLNNWLKAHPKHNINSIVYDRSPLQERAAFVITTDRPFLFRIALGKIIFEFAKTPYFPIDFAKNISVGLLIENSATKLIRKHKNTAMTLGALNFSVDSLHQNYDDYFYTRLNHDLLYSKLDRYGQEILHFFKEQRFSTNAIRLEFPEDVFKPYSEK